jgi:hypothetical protein
MAYICNCIQKLLCVLQGLGVMGKVSKNLAHASRNSKGLALQIGAVLVSFATRFSIIVIILSLYSLFLLFFIIFHYLFPDYIIFIICPFLRQYAMRGCGMGVCL